jgi:hypothetical protein
METSISANRNSLKLRFVGFYIISIALLTFVIWFLIPRMSPENIITEKPIASGVSYGGDILNKVALLNTEYKRLKQLDQQYANKIIDSADASDLIKFNQVIFSTEKKLIKKIDSLESIAETYTDQESADLLHSFIESFRMVVNDRTAMQAFKTTSLLKSSTKTDQQQELLKMQNEIQARNSRIVALENQVNSLESKSNTVAVTPPKPIEKDQQNLDALQTTVNAQEKKIAALTSENARLEKEARANSQALEQMRKSTDNNSTASKNQSALLEKRVNELNAEIRLAQVDCSLSRVDATQIISNAKQRKALLADALNTLNALANTGDASIKKKVADKVNRLNQVASTLRD